MEIFLFLFGITLGLVVGNPCIQTSDITYSCPPYPAQTQAWPGIEANMNPPPDWGLDSYVGTGKLEGKVAIITGGDSGIGRAVALAFAREGAKIVISYLNETEDAKTVLSAIEQSGSDGIIIPGDISNETHVAYIVDQAVTNFGQIDILVNNAATQASKLDDFLDLSHERILYTFQVNIIPMFDFARYVIPYMKAGGSIINTASVQAYDPSWQVLDYASTKGAIVTFTKGLAQYSIQKGIRTNCVAPGPVWTPLIVTSWPAAEVATFGMNNSDLGRPAQPAELAPTYVHLASAEASYINGAVVGINGGFFLP
eukprot:Phypoly_transcript_13745.p1 GENE.Phypoly_transcript_13745~~Phypoly_transcript_13745.p1  ORF type:complete len:312 (+),score=47.05 Phypoly_transcript_13745:47-982(+)